MFYRDSRALAGMATWLLAAFLVAPASAQPAGAGERLLKQGIKQYDGGSLDASLRTLEQAVKAAGSDAKLLGQIHLYRGVCHAVMGDAGKAKEAFRAALQHDPTVTLDPDQFKRSVLEVFREVQGDLKAYLTVRTEPPGAEVIIRGKAIGRTPITRHVVPAGETFVVVRLGGKELIRRAEPRPGQELTVDMRLDASVPPASTVTPASAPASSPAAAAADQPAGPSVLRPGTRRGYLSLGLGGGFALNDNISAFQLTEELGFHFRRGSSGPGLALVAAQAFGSVETYMDGCSADVIGTLYRVDAAVKFFWDIQVSSRLGLYIAPFLQAGYVYNHVSPDRTRYDYSLDSFTSHGGTVDVGSDVKLLLGDRGLIFVRPVGILVTVTDSLTKNEGTDTYTCEGQRTAVHYQLLIGGGVTF